VRFGRATVLATAVLATLALGACSSGDDAPAPGAQPRVDWLDDMFAAIAAARGDEPAYVEVSATLESVDAIVRDGDGDDAVLYRFDGEALDGPIEPRDDARATFAAAEVTVDTDRIFDGIREELSEPAIIDLAVRKEGQALIVDATVAGEEGGVLLVLLGADGQVLGIQAA
jgi:hypothetical protein